MKRHWVRRFLYGAALGMGLLVLGFIGPGLVGGAALVDWMLKPAYQIPEFIQSYTPDLVWGMTVSLMSGLAAALAGFMVWDVSMLIARPTGPGQVGAGWRPLLWGLTLAAVLIAAFTLPYVALTSWLDTVETRAATWIAFMLAAMAAAVFWLLSIVGTERMIRAAVPWGRFFTGVL